MKKRLLAMFLCLCMVASLMPMMAFATTTSNATEFVASNYEEGEVVTGSAALITTTAPVEHVIPSVTTSTPIEIEMTSATLGGTIIYDGGDVVTGSGVVISITDINPTLESEDVRKIEIDPIEGDFSKKVSGLIADTKYYIRAYATNSIGNAYGEVKTMTTLKNTYGLSGVVTSDGSTVSGAAVQIKIGQMLVGETVTNESGLYSFIGLENGNYSLLVTKDDKEAITPIVIENSNLIQDVDLASDSGNSSGVVIETPEVTMDADSMKVIETSRVQVSMDADGYYAIRLIDEGRYVNAFYDGQVSDTSNIDVKYGDSVRSWYNLPKKEFSIENENIIKMVREDDEVRYILRLSIVNATKQGGYMKVEMEMENLKSEAQELGTFIYWDTMIDTNDGSPFEVIENGWRNYYNDFQVSAFLKDSLNVTNADAIWMGDWGQESWTDNPRMTWNQHAQAIGQTVATDDTAAGAWYDPITVEPGTSRKISNIIGVGPKNEPPILISPTIDPDIDGETVSPGDEIVIKGEAGNNDDIGTEMDIISIIDDNDIYRKILGSVTVYKNTQQAFEYSYIIPEGLAPGEHTLKVYLIDDTGVTSTLEAITFYIAEKSQAEIILNGESEITIERYEVYEELGATVTGDDGNGVLISGQVDTSKVGDYTVTYTSADNAGIVATETRIVKVIDTTSPVISLVGEAEVIVELDQVYEELGATVSGDDGNGVIISGQVDTSKVGDYTVTYTSTDNAGNVATKTRIVRVVEKNTHEISGTVNKDDNTVSGAAVKLKQGGVVIGETITDESGKYRFAGLKNGVYNLVVTKDKKIVTSLIVIKDVDVEQNVKLPSENKNSILVVEGTDTPAIVVGGLEAIAEKSSESNLEIKMIVEKKTENQAVNAGEIKKVARGSKLDFLDMKVIQTIEGREPNTLSDLGGVIEVVTPYDFTGKRDVKVYRYHGENVNTFTKLGVKPTAPYADGTYYIDQENGFIYIYTQKFSTYAIGYRTGSGESSGGSSSKDRDNTDKSYEININQTDGGTISLDKESANKTFTIKADEGYIIVDVLVDGKSVGPVEKYTFEKLDKDHRIKAIFEKQPIVERENPFIDIRKDHWFYDQVLDAFEKGLIVGTSDTEFGPHIGASRAMIATIIHRLETRPDYDLNNPFYDVLENEWYSDGISWSAEHIIVKGYGQGIYKPNQIITREELSAIVYRYANYKGLDMNKESKLSRFIDKDEVGSWAKDSVSYATSVDLFEGNDLNMLEPKKNVTRAEVAKVITRLLELTNK